MHYRICRWQECYGNHIPICKQVVLHGYMAGGAHHTCYSQNLTAEHLEDFADMASIEFALIGKDTRLSQFKNELRFSEVYYQLNK
jgi:L-arabinose isomerase